MFENQAGNIARRIPLLLVDLIQQVERVGKHVAGTACGIADGQVLRGLDLENVLIPGGIILGRLDIVLPVFDNWESGCDRTQSLPTVFCTR